ncbi:unnamed protein product [Dicrocoelium dendriticum]|nr:unnamed protein product [Dicrocoelium dendriticum]
MNLVDLADGIGLRHDTIDFAQWLDDNDPLREYRSEFHIPTLDSVQKLTKVSLSPCYERRTSEVIYLCGNSLGLQPKRLDVALQTAVRQWADLGVLAYHYGQFPASSSDLDVTADVAKYIVGADPDEVATTANLSVNMHTLLAAFYRPQGNKTLIMVEKGLFPTDYYVLESHVSWHGLDPKEHLLQIEPRPGEWCISTQHIIETIQTYSDRLALIWLPGVQYATGQLFEIEKITEAGHKYAGCYVGWDLAHSVGNTLLELHKWNVDIAVWCCYKYLNGSPGAVGGLFVHQRHHHAPSTHGPAVRGQGTQQLGPQWTGWFSHRAETRMEMTNRMELATGAAAYRISNPPFLLLAALRASLDVFKQCGGMRPVREKSVKLTGYLECLLKHGKFTLPSAYFTFVTPSAPEERGAQLTIAVSAHVQDIFEELQRAAVIVDLRHPNFIRVTPVPMYNTFVELYHFAKCLSCIVSKIFH